MEKKDNQYQDDKIELVYRLIDRLDTYRGSVSNRAAMLISANALILTGITFLANQILSDKAAMSIGKFIAIITLAVTAIQLIISTVYATAGVVNVWKTSRNILGGNIGKRLFFHPTDTVKTFQEFSDFKKAFKKSKIEDLYDYALGELWTVTHLHYQRYQKLRKAIKLFLCSIITFVISIFLVLLLPF